MLLVVIVLAKQEKHVDSLEIGGQQEHTSMEFRMCPSTLCREGTGKLIQEFVRPLWANWNPIVGIVLKWEIVYNQKRLIEFYKRSD